MFMEIPLGSLCELFFCKETMRFSIVEESRKTMRFFVLFEVMERL